MGRDEVTLALALVLALVPPTPARLQPVLPPGR
jgi:hypothetical protein